MSVPTENLAGATTIRPFRVDIPDEALNDLRRRIAAVRWPSRELVADRSQGVQLVADDVQGVVLAGCGHWVADKHLRSCWRP
jgi:hypothetical protein